MLFDAIEEFVVTFTPNDFAEEISAFGKDGSFVFVRLVLVLVLVIILSFSVFPRGGGGGGGGRRGRCFRRRGNRCKLRFVIA